MAYTNAFKLSMILRAKPHGFALFLSIYRKVTHLLPCVSPLHHFSRFAHSLSLGFTDLLIYFPYLPPVSVGSRRPKRLLKPPKNLFLGKNICLYEKYFCIFAVL
ncbi:hypothetical protein [Microvirus D_HF4_144]|nr:hypothetical protein [Microvirus D_HF4_144]